jgi:hypothetical protein
MRVALILLSITMLLVGSGLGIWSAANGHTTLFMGAIVPLIVGGILGVITFLIEGL